jgi:hypothetical protein
LTAVSGHAQQATVSNVGGGPQKGRELNFPVVSLPDRTAAKKINDYLQIHVLEQTTLKAPGMQVFNKTKWTETRPGFDVLEYKVYANNGKLLSIGIVGEWIAAHPDNYEDYFVFNAQNGDLVLPEDLFTPQGLKELEEEVKRKRAVLIEAHLKELKNNQKANDNLESIKEDLIRCNQHASLRTFYMTNSAFVFRGSPCLPHAISNMDADTDVSYSFGQLRPRLSTFGQKLFSTEQDISKDTFPSLSKPLRGKIDNKYDIVMQLNFYDDHSVGGVYYYNNYQSAIDISGKLDNGVLELKEHDADYNDIAVFTGTVKGTVFSGTWTNLKTKKALPFAVKN